jgi:hypothetical protein
MFLAIVMLLCCGGSGPAQAGAMHIGAAKGTATGSIVTAGTVVGYRLQRVIIPVTFTGDGDTSGLDAHITFNIAGLTLVRSTAIGGATCDNTFDSTTGFVHVNVPLQGSPLPAELRYCDIVIDVGAAAPGGSITFNVTSTCTDSIGSMAPCQNVNGALKITNVQTNVQDGYGIVIGGYESTPQESRSLKVTNLGTGPLNISCGLNPATPGLSLTGPSVIAGGQSADVVVTCQLPALGAADLLSNIQCTTSDSIRPQLLNGVSCTTVATGGSIPGDQLGGNQLKSGDQLGTSAAQSTVGSNGKGVIALGAPYAGGDSRGRVMLYEGDTQVTKAFQGGLVAESDGNLRPVAMLGPPPGKTGKSPSDLPVDKFGAAVVMTPDGLRIVIGAPGFNGNQGAVFVYQRPNTPGGWSDLDTGNPATPFTQVNPPAMPGLVPEDFGNRIVFTPEGDLVVGASKTDVNGVADAGAVFRYPKNGAGFDATPDTALTSPAGVVNGYFGAALAMDTNALVVGAPQEGNSQSGAAYLIAYIAQTFLAPQGIPSSILQPGNKFGTSVAASGGTVVIGAPGTTTSAGMNTGAAGVYSLEQTPPTPVPRTILIPQPGTGQGAGTSVATNGDIIAVGAPNSDEGAGPGQGRVYAYVTKPVYATNETPKQKLKGAGGKPNDKFGSEVSISQRQIVVGSPLRSLVLSDNTVINQAGQGDPFLLDGVFRNGFE